MLYRAEDFSLSDSFSSDVVQVPVAYQGRSPVLALESFGGLRQHEFRKLERSPLNTLKVQPGVAKLFGPSEIAFIPAEETLADILELYKLNHTCAISERKRFDEVPHLQTSTYTLGVGPYFKEDLFTRHPLTGKVTRHRHPYTALPKFTLPIHPCIAVTTATYLIDLLSDAPPISDTLLAIRRLHVFNRFWARIPKYSSAKSITRTFSTSSSSSSNSSQSSTSSSRSRCSTLSSCSSRSCHSPSPDAKRPEKRKMDIESTRAISRPTKIQRREPSAARASFANDARAAKRSMGHEHGNIRCAYADCAVDSVDPSDRLHSRASKKLPQRRRLATTSRQTD